MTKVKEESEKVGLKLNIQKTKIMASGPITSRQINGEKMETVRDFIFDGLQNPCRWNEKTLAPWKKSYDKPRQHILLDSITLPTNIHLVKGMVFPIVMYGCKSWIIKKAECWRIDGFELWCWRRLLRVPWIARRSNQSILKKISPEYSLEGLMLKLKLQYFGHLIQRTDLFEKTLMLERLKVGEGDNRQWDDWMASLTQWTWVWVSSRSWW